MKSFNKFLLTSSAFLMIACGGDDGGSPSGEEVTAETAVATPAKAKQNDKVTPLKTLRLKGVNAYIKEGSGSKARLARNANDSGFDAIDEKGDTKTIEQIGGENLVLRDIKIAYDDVRVAFFIKKEVKTVPAGTAQTSRQTSRNLLKEAPVKPVTYFVNPDNSVTPTPFLIQFPSNHFENEPATTETTTYRYFLGGAEKQVYKVHKKTGAYTKLKNYNGDLVKNVTWIRFMGNDNRFLYHDKDDRLVHVSFEKLAEPLRNNQAIDVSNPAFDCKSTQHTLADGFFCYEQSYIKIDADGSNYTRDWKPDGYSGSYSNGIGVGFVKNNIRFFKNVGGTTDIRIFLHRIEPDIAHVNARGRKYLMISPRNLLGRFSWTVYAATADTDYLYYFQLTDQYDPRLSFIDMQGNKTTIFTNTYDIKEMTTINDTPLFIGTRKSDGVKVLASVSASEALTTVVTTTIRWEWGDKKGEVHSVKKETVVTNPDDVIKVLKEGSAVKFDDFSSIKLLK